MTVVFDGDNQGVPGCLGDQLRRDRQYPTWVDDIDGHSPSGQFFGGSDTLVGQRSDANDQRSGGVTAVQNVHAVLGGHRRQLRGQGALGVAHDRWAVVDIDRFSEQFAQTLTVARGRNPDVGNHGQHRQIPHAVVAGTVVAGHPGTVKRERHGTAVQRAVHEQLVERPVEERRIEGHHGMQSAQGHTRCRGNGVLLGDAHIEETVGEFLLEFQQTGRSGHCRRDGDNIGPLPGYLEQLPGKCCRPSGSCLGQRYTGVRIYLPDAVEAICVVGLRWRVPTTLLGDGMNDDRTVELLGLAQGPLDLGDIVTIDRADVLQAQVLEHALRRDDVLDPLLHAVQSLVGRPAQNRSLLEHSPTPVEESLVALGGAQSGQVARHPADRGRIGTLVVVDNDDHLPVGSTCDVVQRLPGHTTGERTVADHGDDMALTEYSPRLPSFGEPVGPGQGCGGMGILDQVVSALLPRGIAGETTGLAQLIEFRCSAGEDLVDVCLVPGVPDDRVVR